MPYGHRRLLDVCVLLWLLQNFRLLAAHSTDDSADQTHSPKISQFFAYKSGCNGGSKRTQSKERNARQKKGEGEEAKEAGIL